MTDPANTPSGRDEDVVIGSTGLSPRVIIGLLIVAAFIVFIVQNTEDTQLQFLMLRFKMPMWGLALTLFGGGFIVGWLLHVRRSKRKRTQG